MGIGRSLSLLQCAEISRPAAAFYSGRKGAEMNEWIEGDGRMNE